MSMGPAGTTSAPSIVSVHPAASSAPRDSSVSVRFLQGVPGKVIPHLSLPVVETEQEQKLGRLFHSRTPPFSRQ